MRLLHPAEHKLYGAVVAFMATVYLVFPFISHHRWFGVSQYWHLGLAWEVASVSVVLLLALWAWSHPVAFDAFFVYGPEDSTPTSWWKYLALSVLSFLAFFLLRNHFINLDGLAFTPKFIHDIPLRGSHVTHDEMWELYLHSRFWFLTDREFGWSVPFSYQVLSSLAGSVFVVMLVRMAARISGGQWRLLVLAMLSGGVMQLFFGDVENYTLTSVLIMGYLFSGWLMATGRISSLIPALVLPVAMTFHLLSGWLLPSLVFLFFLDWRRGNKRVVMLGMVGGLIIIGGTLFFFAAHGLPLSDLYYHSHALGHGGHIFWNFAKPSLGYDAEMADLLLLLFPGALMVVPLLVWHRIKMEPGNIFLVLASVFMLIFMFTWKADMGAYQDWNLYAPVAIPLSLLCWYNFLRIDELPFKRPIFVALVGLGCLHTYTWVISNHLL